MLEAFFGVTCTSFMRELQSLYKTGEVKEIAYLVIKYLQAYMLVNICCFIYSVNRSTNKKKKEFKFQIRNMMS